MSWGRTITGAAGILGLIAAFVTGFEGTRTAPYQDSVGVWTVCRGHTGDVEQRPYSMEECDDLLHEDASAALSVVDSAVTVPITDPTRAALASFVFNVGAHAFRTSTLLRRLNNGEGKTACNELLRWVYAGGEKLSGLVRRREAERELCRLGFVPVPLPRPVGNA